MLLQWRLKLRPKSHLKNIVYDEEETHCSETVLSDFFFPTEYAKSGGFSHLNLLRECKYLCVWLEELQGEKKEKCHGDITQKHHFTDAFV